MIKDVEKISATKFKEFLKCKKMALKNLAGATAADLEGCVDDLLNPNSIAANSKGKIGKSLAKLGSDITKKCINGNVFPGRARQQPSVPWATASTSASSAASAWRSTPSTG